MFSKAVKREINMLYNSQLLETNFFTFFVSLSILGSAPHFLSGPLKNTLEWRAQLSA